MLNYAPAEISDQEDIVVTFDARLLNTILQNALLTKEGRNLIPVLIREAAEGRLPVLRAHLRDYLLSVPRKTLSPAVYLSHICRDETPFDNPEALERAREEAGELGYMITETWDRDQCEVWPAGYADPVENTAVQSMVPALLLAGSYDPLTPPSLAYSAAAQLPNGYVYELTEASHGALFGNDCAQSLLTEFLNQPLRAPAGDCQAGQLAEMPTR